MPPGAVSGAHRIVHAGRVLPVLSASREARGRRTLGTVDVKPAIRHGRTMPDRVAPCRSPIHTHRHGERNGPPSGLLPPTRQALKLVQPMLLPDIGFTARTEHHHGPHGVGRGTPSLDNQFNPHTLTTGAGPPHRCDTSQYGAMVGGHPLTIRRNPVCGASSINSLGSAWPGENSGAGRRGSCRSLPSQCKECMPSKPDIPNEFTLDLLSGLIGEISHEESPLAKEPKIPSPPSRPRAR